MILDDSKTARQEEGVAKFIANKGRGIYHYPPGFGKTYCGILTANKILSADEEKIKLLVVTPSLGVKDVWIKALKVFNFKYDYDVVNIGSLDIRTLSDYRMCIIDEYHKYTSDNRLYIVKEIVSSITYVLGLTATPAYGSTLFKEVRLPIIDTIPEKVAIEKGWISKFVEYNIKVEFEDDDKIRYAKFSKPIFELQELFRGSAKMLNSGGNVFKSDVDVMYSCFYGRTTYIDDEPVVLPADRIRSALANRKGWNVNLDLTNEYNKMLNTYWNPSVIEGNVKLFVELTRNRNNMLINNKAKLTAILKLCNAEEVPTIIFNESTEFADLIAECIGFKAIVYHSNVKSRPMWDITLGDYIRYKSGAKAGEPKIFGRDTLRKIAINGMITGLYKVIISARALDEGVDIPNLERVITSAGTTNPLTYSQRSGRGKRVDIYNKDKVTKIYNFYFDDFRLSEDTLVYSRDKQKLIKRQEGSTDVIWIDSVDELL